MRREGGRKVGRLSKGKSKVRIGKRGGKEKGKGGRNGKRKGGVERAWEREMCGKRKLGEEYRWIERGR